MKMIIEAGPVAGGQNWSQTSRASSSHGPAMPADLGDWVLPLSQLSSIYGNANLLSVLSL